MAEAPTEKASLANLAKRIKHRLSSIDSLLSIFDEDPRRAMSEEEEIRAFRAAWNARRDAERKS